MAILGNSTILGSSNTTGGGQACVFQAIEAGTVTSLSMYFRSTGVANIKFVIYSSNAGVPDVLLAESALSTVGTTFSWITLPISYSFITGQSMFLGVLCDDNTIAASTPGTVNQTYQDSIFWPTFPTAPNPSTYSSQSNNELSVYVTYTPAGPPSISPKTIKGVQSFKGVQSIKF